jgi:hypothetical protein
LQTLQTLFPVDTVFPNTIKPLTPAQYLRLVLVPEVTIALIMELEGCRRIDAMKSYYVSCNWGGAFLPLASGTQGESLDVEYQNMQEQKWVAACAYVTGNDKGKAIMPGEVPKSPLVYTKEETEGVVVIADYSVGILSDGTEFIMLNDDSDSDQ